ncbi:MAG TPA: ATP synthase F1 subunit epsilon [Polyangiaceae bacterium]|nr:ATP synthase F1 subunit epsilon [Polyangiaceae bacterium]
MAGKISLEIVTPDGVQLSLDVDEFTAPSVEGEFGVLPGHRPLLAGLRTGIVRYQVGGESHAVAVGPGFVKLQGEEARLLTDSFADQASVDPVVARKELKEAEEKLTVLSVASAQDELAKAIKAARWAAVRLELYGDPPPATVVIAHETRLLGHEDYSALAEKPEVAEPDAAHE